MEEIPQIQSAPIIFMNTTRKILRSSIHCFLNNYNYFTSTSLLLTLPFSASILLSQALVPSMTPLPLPIHARLQSLFNSSSLMPSSQFFSPFNLKLSQTISASIFTLPFTLSFLLLSKASAIQPLYCDKKTTFRSFLPLYKPLLLTHICNSFIVLSVNASGFFMLLLVFHIIDALGIIISPNFLLFVSAAGVVLQSVVVANVVITGNLALIVAGMERCSGYLAVLKACVLMRGKASTALSLVLPVNLGLSALESLFQYRVVRACWVSSELELAWSVALEGLLIAYLYSLLTVVDTITTCVFYKSCKSGSLTYGVGSDPYRIELQEEENGEAEKGQGVV